MAVQRSRRKKSSVQLDTTGDGENTDSNSGGKDVSGESSTGTDQQVREQLTTDNSEPKTETKPETVKGTNTMSIFGNLTPEDLAEIPDDPFYIKPDTYWAICIEAVQKVTEAGDTQCVITWQIDEPDNEFHGKKKQEYFALYPHRQSWADYTPDEKQATVWFRRRLRRGFDLSESELATVNFSDLIGKGAYITLVERMGKEGTDNANKKFINIFEAVSKRLYDEEKETSNSAAASVGLL